MFILILIILVILFVIFLVVSLITKRLSHATKTNCFLLEEIEGDAAECGAWICFASIIVNLIIIAVLSFKVTTNAKIIDEKITMYQEENSNIETNIAEAVKGYMEYESNTYAEFKNESAISLVSLISDLKTDTLVSKQIDVYITNNDKIKELREEEINLSKIRWLLYFDIDKLTNKDS